MVLDECPPWPVDRDACAQACGRSLAWARRCREIAEESGFPGSGRHVFAIAQGSTYDDLRREAAGALSALDFSGYAVGGVSVGEPEPEMLKQVAATTPFLPADKPRYTMGLGTPPQILKMVALGVDMFDCVLPTRVARNGLAFTPDGPINLGTRGFGRTPARWWRAWTTTRAAISPGPTFGTSTRRERCWAARSSRSTTFTSSST